MKSRNEYIVTENGKKKAVVMPLAEYERLLEDLHDLSVIAERRDEPTASLNDVKRRLRADGLLPD